MLAVSHTTLLFLSLIYPSVQIRTNPKTMFRRKNSIQRIGSYCVCAGHGLLSLNQVRPKRGLYYTETRQLVSPPGTAQVSHVQRND